MEEVNVHIRIGGASAVNITCDCGRGLDISISRVGDTYRKEKDTTFHPNVPLVSTLRDGIIIACPQCDQHYDVFLDKRIAVRKISKEDLSYLLEHCK